MKPKSQNRGSSSSRQHERHSLPETFSLSCHSVSHPTVIPKGWPMKGKNQLRSPTIESPSLAAHRQRQAALAQDRQTHRHAGL
jgi:hypothetical protein